MGIMDDIPKCWDMSGVRGFFGEGYWYHKVGKPLGLDFRGSMFISKTTTLNRNLGNMPLKSDGITPKEWFPKCVKMDFLNSAVLNAVDLSCSGAKHLFDTGRWQAMTQPFGISFMAVEKKREDRRKEREEFCTLFKSHLKDFQAEVFFQENFSCKNTASHDMESPMEVVDEAQESLSLSHSILGIEQVPKFNVHLPIEGVLALQGKPYCHGLCVSNALKWQEDSRIPWHVLFPWYQMFNGGKSPLWKFGGGALSGPLLFSLVVDWLIRTRQSGVTMPLIMGGGVFRPRDVNVLSHCGASAVALGSVAMLRGHRVRRIIQRAHSVKFEGLCEPIPDSKGRLAGA